MTTHTVDTETETDFRVLFVSTIPEPVDFHGSVVTFVGTDADGENIFFAVDHRPAAWIIAALHSEGEVKVAVEDWQIVGKGAF